MPALVKKKNVLDWVISARRLIRPHSAVNVNELSGISMNKVLVPSGKLLPLTFPMAFHFFLMPTSHSHPLLCVVGCVVLKKKKKKRNKSNNKRRAALFPMCGCVPAELLSGWMGS